MREGSRPPACLFCSRLSPTVKCPSVLFLKYDGLRPAVCSDWCLCRPRVPRVPPSGWRASSQVSGCRPFAVLSMRCVALLPSLYEPKETTGKVGPRSGPAACAGSSAGQPGEAGQRHRPKPCGSVGRICLPRAPRRTRASPEPGGRAPWDRDLEMPPSQRPINSSLEPSAAELMQNESRFVMALAPESLGKILFSARQSKLQASLQGLDSRSRKHTSSDTVPLTISCVVFHGTQSDNSHARRAGGRLSWGCHAGAGAPGPEDGWHLPSAASPRSAQAAPKGQRDGLWPQVLLCLESETQPLRPPWRPQPPRPSTLLSLHAQHSGISSRLPASMKSEGGEGGRACSPQLTASPTPRRAESEGWDSGPADLGVDRAGSGLWCGRRAGRAAAGRALGRVLKQRLGAQGLGRDTGAPGPAHQTRMSCAQASGAPGGGSGQA